MWLDKLKKVASTAFAGRAWPQPPWHARASPAEPKVKPAEQPELKPKLLQFDAQGNLQTLREERTKIQTHENFSWRTWHEAPALRQTLDEEMAKSILLLVVQRLFFDMPAPKGVHLVRRRGALSCVASMDLEPRALRIAPVVTGRQFIVAKTQHPHAIFVQVPLRQDMIVPLYIVPELKLPKTPIQTVDVPVVDGEAALTDHNWSSENRACLFWAVTRPKVDTATRGDGDAVQAPNDPRTNASFEWVDVVTMLGIEATGTVQTVTTGIPIITNRHAIASGDVIYLPPTAQTPKPQESKAPRTWLTDLMTEMRRTSQAS